MTLLHRRCPISIDSFAKYVELDQLRYLVKSLAGLLLHFRRPLPSSAFFFIFLYAWLGTVDLVRAEGLEGVVDMSSLTCADVLRMPLPQALVVVGWIGGFYGGLENNTRLDVSKFANDADEIVALCRKNETISVMTLVEQTLGFVRRHKP